MLCFALVVCRFCRVPSTWIAALHIASPHHALPDHTSPCCSALRVSMLMDVLYCTRMFQRVFEPRKLEFLGLTDSGPKAACAGCAGFAAFSVVIEKFLDRHE
ncbi:hypothetical protein HN51_065997 [Arachis hypogaea]